MSSKSSGMAASPSMTTGNTATVGTTGSRRETGSTCEVARHGGRPRSIDVSRAGRQVIRAENERAPRNNSFYNYPVDQPSDSSEEWAFSTRRQETRSVNRQL